MVNGDETCRCSLRYSMITGRLEEGAGYEPI
jgi:hypothetical protein